MTGGPGTGTISIRGPLLIPSVTQRRLPWLQPLQEPSHHGGQAASLSNQGVFRPFSYLMVEGYGVGAFINADNRKGYVEDASCFGGRLDYAVAANLNVYGSFLLG